MYECSKGLHVIGKCDVKDSRVTDSVFNLVKLGEHTWGLPGVYDTVNWTNQHFSRARSGGCYIVVKLISALFGLYITA